MRFFINSHRKLNRTISIYKYICGRANPPVKILEFFRSISAFKEQKRWHCSRWREVLGKPADAGGQVVPSRHLARSRVPQQSECVRYRRWKNGNYNSHKEGKIALVSGVCNHVVKLPFSPSFSASFFSSSSPNSVILLHSNILTAVSDCFAVLCEVKNLLNCILQWTCLWIHAFYHSTATHIISNKPNDNGLNLLSASFTLASLHKLQWN